MKRVIILMLMVASTSAIFAQKEKQEIAKKGKSASAMATYSCPMHPEVKSSKPGKCSKCGMDLTRSKKEQMKAEVTHAYTCPTHSDVVSSDPGKCPQCNSKLVVDRRGSKQASTVYTCSMHPDVSSHTDGKCPKCGMAMEEKKPRKSKSKS